MSFNAASLRLMAEKGLTAIDIAEIAEAAENGRSAGAARQARYRQRGGGKIPEGLRETVFERDGWRCLDCGSEEYLHCDHVIPVSKGGETALENLQTLCRPCNAKKKDRVRKRDKSRSRSTGASAGISGGTSAEASPQGFPKEINQTPSLPPVVVSEAEASSPQPRPWSLPPGLSLQVWTDLLTNRKRKRLPNTPTAWAKFQTDLAEIAAQTGIPPPKIIEMCAAKGWGAIYDPTEDHGHGRSTNGLGRHQPDDGLSSTTRAAISVFGPPSVGQSR